MITLKNLKAVYRDLKVQLNPNRDILNFIQDLEEFFNLLNALEKYHAARNVALDRLCNVIKGYRKTRAKKTKQRTARIIFMQPNYVNNDLKN